MKPTEQRFRDNETGCILWTAYKDRDGYGTLGSGGKGGLALKAHRYAWSLSNGLIPAGLLVCHTCDIPSCCSPKHLFLGTHKDNAADKVAKGRCQDQRGAKNAVAKLTDIKALEIFLAKGTQVSIATKYGINFRTVSYIKQRKLWKHVTTNGDLN